MEYPMLLNSLILFLRAAQHGADKEEGKARGVDSNIPCNRACATVLRNQATAREGGPLGAVLFQTFFLFFVNGN
jgi:hypothetical protein